jgi:hypothetical protein
MHEMFHVILAQISGIEPEWISAGIAFVAVWTRLEHRLTKLETLLEKHRK